VNVFKHGQDVLENTESVLDEVGTNRKELRSVDPRQCGPKGRVCEVGSTHSSCKDRGRCPSAGREAIRSASVFF